MHINAYVTTTKHGLAVGGAVSPEPRADHKTIIECHLWYTKQGRQHILHNIYRSSIGVISKAGQFSPPLWTDDNKA